MNPHEAGFRGLCANAALALAADAGAHRNPRRTPPMKRHLLMAALALTAALPAQAQDYQAMIN